MEIADFNNGVARAAYALAVDWFENKGSADRWLQKYNVLLRGIPVNFLETEIGAQEVYDLIDSWKYGFPTGHF